MKRNIYKELKQAKNIEEMARKISEITWCCADCSSDNREQCEKCLKDILSQNMEDIESPKSDKSGEYAIAYLNESGNGFSDREPWIEDIGKNIENVLARIKELENQSYLKITPFCYGDDELDSYTWDYVNRHKIAFER